MSGHYLLNPWSTEFWQPFLSNPVKGEVDQDILPSWFSTYITVTGQGEPELEQKIVTEVATYGKQIGELTDVVLALAESANFTDSKAQEAVRELRSIEKKVELKKKAYRSTVQQRAERALQELAKSDPDGLAQLIDSFQSPCVIHES